MEIIEYIQDYLKNIVLVTEKIDQTEYKKIVDILIELKRNQARLFLLGVGGSAGNCSHAVNDFRKICNIETYAPTDNVSELTARTNDDGFDTIFSEWLKTSHLNSKDVVMVFSVGGGNLENNISTNIVKALQYAKSLNSKVIGIVSRDGGYTKKVADGCILIPIIKDEYITPLAESFQAVIWHSIVNYPGLVEPKNK